MSLQNGNVWSLKNSNVGFQFFLMEEIEDKNKQKEAKRRRKNSFSVATKSSDKKNKKKKKDKKEKEKRETLNLEENQNREPEKDEPTDNEKPVMTSLQVGVDTQENNSRRDNPTSHEYLRGDHDNQGHKLTLSLTKMDIARNSKECDPEMMTDTQNPLSSGQLQSNSTSDESPQISRTVPKLKLGSTALPKLSLGTQETERPRTRGREEEIPKLSLKSAITIPKLSLGEMGTNNEEPSRKDRDKPSIPRIMVEPKERKRLHLFCNC
jgi:hypothetical protein